MLDGVTRPVAEVDRFLVDPTNLSATIHGHVDYWGDGAYPTVAGEITGNDQRGRATRPSSQTGSAAS